MADITVEQKHGGVEQKQGGQMTWLWALLALAAVAGLMIWLANVAEPTNMVTEGEVVREGPGLDFATISGNPGAFLDSIVVVRDARVDEVLTSRAMLVEADGMESPWLVVIGPEVSGFGEPMQGDVYTVTGSLGTPAATTLEGWVSEGVIDESTLALAEAAPYVVLASEVTSAEAAADAAAPADTPAVQQ